MAEQINKQPSKQEKEEPEAVEAKDLRNEELSDEVDDLLADIDDVIGDLTDEQALDFVEGFVQKGGQ